MTERPYSRYTRAKTWAALYSQHINAGYALVPASVTNNSIDVVRCDSPEEAQALTRALIEKADILLTYYEAKARYEEIMAQARPGAPRPQAPALPDILAGVARRLRSAAVLARSHDYYRYHLADDNFRLVICGLHDSYLRLPVWEVQRGNTRYKSRETAVALTSPEFAHLRTTQFGHNILVAACAEGDQTALALVATLPKRTRTRINREKDLLQDYRYRGRPLAFLTEERRAEIGNKISVSLKRYHAQRHLRII